MSASATVRRALCRAPVTGKKQQTEVRRRKKGRKEGKGIGEEGRRRLQAASLTAAERAVPAAAAAGRQSLLYSWDLKEELKRAEKGEGDATDEDL